MMQDYYETRIKSSTLETLAQTLNVEIRRGNYRADGTFASCEVGQWWYSDKHGNWVGIGRLNSEAITKLRELEPIITKIVTPLSNKAPYFSSITKKGHNTVVTHEKTLQEIVETS